MIQTEISIIEKQENDFKSEFCLSTVRRDQVL